MALFTRPFANANIYHVLRVFVGAVGAAPEDFQYGEVRAADDGGMVTRDPVADPAEDAAQDSEPATGRSRRRDGRGGDAVRLDADGVVTAWSAAASRATGLSGDVMVGRKLQTFCVAGTLDETLATLRTGPATVDLSLDCESAGAVRLQAVISVRRDAAGALTGYDVDLVASGRRQATGFGLADGAAPEYAATRQWAMQDAPAFLVDPQTLRILESNVAAGRAMGRPAQEMVGRFLSDILDPERNRVQRQVPDDQGAGMAHLRLAGRDGAPRSYGMSLVPVQWRDRSLAVCVLHELTGWVGMHMDLAASNEELSRLARHDHLTGLFNKAMFQDTLELANSRVDRSDSLMAVLYIDLDGFKPINDRFGHDVGDRLLVEVVRRLQSGLRSSDVMARLGGDEFGAILENLRRREDALKVARNLIERLKEPFEAGGERIHISASIGAVVTAQSVADASALVAQADRTMYQAKSLGRGRAALAPASAAPKRRRITRPS